MRSSALGAVLVGGRSRRMGRDKARLRLGDLTLAERAASQLGELLDDVVLVSRRPGEYADLGWLEIADLRSGLGPLAGLEAALNHADGRPVFLLACDLPIIGSEALAHVLAAATQHRGSTLISQANGRSQPLCALYSAACLPVVERRLREGRLRMLDLIEELLAIEIVFGPELSFYRPDLLDNVNRPADAARLGLEA